MKRRKRAPIKKVVIVPSVEQGKYSRGALEVITGSKRYPGAVHSLTLAMAADHISEGIIITCVVPATADTPCVGRLLDQVADSMAMNEGLIARQTMGRLVTVEEIARAICYLDSPLTSSITGIGLDVDDGVSGLRNLPK